VWALPLASGSSSLRDGGCSVSPGGSLRGVAVRIDLDGGTLHIDWREDGVWIDGPSAIYQRRC